MSFTLPYPLIQVAGIKSREDAEMMISGGVNSLGFPLRLDINVEDMPETEAAKIIPDIKPPVYPVLITYLDKADEIIAFSRYLGTNIVQLHGEIDFKEIELIKSKSDQFIIKSLIVGKYDSKELKEQIEDYSKFADAFITDTYDPSTGAVGATGKVHDWSISRRIVEISEKPVILAGGLNPANVADAIRTVQPYGVDSHSGVEDENGNNDPSLVKEFVSNAIRTFKEYPT